MPTWNEVVAARSVAATYDPIWKAAGDILAICHRSMTVPVVTESRLREDIQAIAVAEFAMAPLLPTITLDATTFGRIEAMRTAAGDWTLAAKDAVVQAAAALAEIDAAAKAIADRAEQLPAVFAGPTKAQIAPPPALRAAAAALQTAVLTLIEPPEPQP